MKINSRFSKIAVAAGLTVASGAGVLGLTGFASAQMAQHRTAAVAQVADSNDGTTAQGEVVVDAGGAVGVTGVESAPDANRPNPLAVVAKALGITESELQTQLKAGKSIADIAKAQNVDLADVKKALLDDLKAHLDSEVASGEHTQEEADAKYKEMESRIDKMLTEVGGPRGGRGDHGGPEGGRGGHGPMRFATDGLSKVLNLSSTELQTQLQSGKSLADIAKAQNVDIADVKAQLTADFKAHLDEEVTSGEHTQAEADQKLAEFKTGLDDMVNRVGPAGRPEGRGGHDFGGRGGHGPMGARPGQAQGGNPNTGQSSSGSY